ncbi:MAG TPA: hypothetical protein VHA11_11960 [Bryobacteraceae bacterium]|nr:hypothetical protein [Bryobacteraceae bacterium]
MSLMKRGSRAHVRLFLSWSGDALRALPFVLGLLFVFRREASAYTDPGTGTLIWQMLAAGFVGLMFYLRKFTTWFRAKKKDTKD